MKINKKDVEYINWYTIMGLDAVLYTKSKYSKLEQFVKPSISDNIYQNISNICEEEDINKANKLAILKQEVMRFDGCSIKSLAKSTVFGDGAIDAKVMLVGEAPGAKEDESGIPFCGESGKLLDNALMSIGLSRKKNVYITNTIFWRPPANRRPTKDEIELCKPFLKRHIEIINPKLLILVGSTAVESVLDSEMKISKVRGEYFEYKTTINNEILTTAIFHPAYLLRNPMHKKTMWYDLLRIKNKILTQFRRAEDSNYYCSIGNLS